MRARSLKDGDENVLVEFINRTITKISNKENQLKICYYSLSIKFLKTDITFNSALSQMYIPDVPLHIMLE